MGNYVFFFLKASEIRVIKIVSQAGDMAQFVVRIQRTCVWFPGPIMRLTPAWNHIQFRTIQGPLWPHCHLNSRI